MTTTIRTYPVTDEVSVAFAALRLKVAVTYIKGDDSYFEVDNVTTGDSRADRALANFFDKHLLTIRDLALANLLKREQETPAP